MGNINIDTESVQADVDATVKDVADLGTRLRLFMNALQEANAETSNGFPLLVTLQNRLQEEVVNVQHLNESCEEANKAVRKLIEKVEDAADDGVFK